MVEKNEHDYTHTAMTVEFSDIIKTIIARSVNRDYNTNEGHLIVIDKYIN